MERRPLGETDVEVSRIILGCGNFGGIGSAPEFFGQGESEEEAFRIMDAAWEFGITTFDTADAYGGGRSETMVGKWIASRGVSPGQYRAFRTFSVFCAKFWGWLLPALVPLQPAASQLAGQRKFKTKSSGIRRKQCNTVLCNPRN